MIEKSRKEIKSVNTFNNHNSMKMMVGKDDVSYIKNNSAIMDTFIHIQFDGYNEEGDIIKTFIGGNLVIEYF